MEEEIAPGYLGNIHATLGLQGEVLDDAPHLEGGTLELASPVLHGGGYTRS